MSAAAKTEAPDVWSAIFEMDGCLTDAESCTQALGKLSEYLGDEPDGRFAEAVKIVVGALQSDLETALVKARGHWHDAHDAIKAQRGQAAPIKA